MHEGRGMGKGREGGAEETAVVMARRAEMRFRRRTARGEWMWNERGRGDGEDVV